MADKEDYISVKEERKIPVFTVLKNGAILKNIFVVNKPLPDIETPDRENEEILVVGRHPDCNIMLTHPSISRYHLQINSMPSLQKLYVTDLASVHGTWISDKKIDPGVRVELNEGYTIRVGGSTRIYRLYWVPLSQAYDLENPFVSKLNMGMAEEEEYVYQDENSVGTKIEHLEVPKSIPVDGRSVETSQDVNSLLTANVETELLDLNLDDDNGCSHFEETSELIAKKEIPSVPPMLEMMNFSFYEGHWGMFFQQNESSSIENLQIESSSMASPAAGGGLESEYQQFDKEDQRPQALVAIKMDPDAESTEKPPLKLHEKSHLLVHTDSLSSVSEEIEGRMIAEILEEMDINITASKHYSKRNTLNCWSVPRETTFENENQIPNSTPACQLPPERIYSENLENSGLLENLNQAVLNEEHSCSPVDRLEETEHRSMSRERYKEATSSWWPEPVGGLPYDKIDQTPEYSLACQFQSEIEYIENPLMEENNDCIKKSSNAFSVEEFSASKRLEETRNMDLTVKDNEKEASLPVEDVLLEIAYQHIDKENQIPLAFLPDEGPVGRENEHRFPIRSEKKSNLGNIWLRRGKASSNLQVQTRRSREKTVGPNIDTEAGLQVEDDVRNQLILDAGEEAEETFTPNKENFTPNTILLKSMMKKKALLEEVMPLKSKKSFMATAAGLQVEGDVRNQSISDVDAEENFTPNKENFTPNTFLLKSMKKKKALLKEVKHSKSKRSMMVTSSPDINPEQDMFALSGKEKQMPRALQEQKHTTKDRMNLERKAERVPFQTLHVNSAGKSEPEVVVPKCTVKTSSWNHRQTMEKKNNSSGDAKRTWNIVVDTSTLLDKESMKSLQLLQGLKGTCLIIPRMVIRELECLNSRISIFRRTTEVTSVLEWIEECMVKSNGWIHVQRTVDEGRPVAPTPRIHVQGSAEVESSTTEIASPTEEDHIIECVLLFRKMRGNGQLVLLSNDITLKIKAMAEGLICETAQEFRKSLVNPFSERFLWKDSSPRGRTWSCSDDIVLRDKYRHCPTKKSSNGVTKGLKLILHYNSRYGKITSNV